MNQHHTKNLRALPELSRKYTVTKGDALLTGTDLVFRYRSAGIDRKVIDGISFDVAKSEIVAIVGVSGCGKSTLLKIAGGLLQPDSGNVRYGDDSPETLLARQELGFVFQDHALFNWRSVFQNILLPWEISGNRNGHSWNGVHERVRDYLRLVGLQGFEKAFPHQLSGGMKSRVAIARALSMDPRVLLMDEPFGNLDEITREKMNHELLRLHEQFQPTILFVTHSVEEAVFLSDRILLLTPRPARIRKEFSVDLPRPRRSAIRRNSKFLSTVDEVRAEMGVIFS